MKSTLVVFTVLLLSLAALAQMEMPKPGPELKKLDYFVGHWTSDGEMKPSPMGAGGKMHMDEDCQWMDGNYFIVIHSKFSGTMGSGTGMAFMGYDTQEKVYTYDEFDSTGEATHSRGTVDGDNWVWTNEEKMGGQMVKGRFSMKILSPTSYSFKFEMSTDGTKWTLVMEGTDTKVK